MNLLSLLPLLVQCLAALTVYGFHGGKSFVGIARKIFSSNDRSLRAEKQQDKVEVYSTAGCKFCRQSKAVLKELGVGGFKNYDLTDYIENTSEYLARMDATTIERFEMVKSSTVPQIFVGSDRVGGCDNLLDEISTGEFLRKLERAGVGLDAKGVSKERDEVPTQSSSSRVALTLDSSGEPILNGAGVRSMRDCKVNDVAKDMQRAALSLLDSFASADGLRIDYRSMAASEEFTAYTRLSAQLRDVPLSDLVELSPNARVCLFANIYNAMIINAHCVVGAPVNTPEARTSFFSGKNGAAYEIAGMRFSADDIEHGVLRANTRHPYSTPLGQDTFFPASDPRSVLAVPRLDPRVHFILNCGANSCPPIKILSGDPEPALAMAAKAYLEENVLVGEEQVTLPKLLFWYRDDFGASEREVLLKVFAMMGGERSDLGLLLMDYLRNKEDNAAVNVKYLDYDWAANSM